MMTRQMKPLHFYSVIGADCEQSNAFLVIAATICTGAIGAICCGFDDDLFAFCTISYAFGSFWTALATDLVKLCGFHLLAFLLGSSYCGYFILPFLSAGFGFFIYNMAQISVKSLSGAELVSLLLVLVLLLVPCFFVIAVDAFTASRQLKLLLSRRGFVLCERRPLHFIVCIPFLILAGIIYVFLGRP